MDSRRINSSISLLAVNNIHRNNTKIKTRRKSSNWLWDIKSPYRWKFLLTDPGQSCSLPPPDDVAMSCRLRGWRTDCQTGRKENKVKRYWQNKLFILDYLLSAALHRGAFLLDERAWTILDNWITTNKQTGPRGVNYRKGIFVIQRELLYN